MSWSDTSLLRPDDFLEPNPFTSTNIGLPTLQPNAQTYTYPFTFEPPRAPRLSSPRLFRDALFPPATSSRQLPRPDFNNTLRDVHSALQNTDMALRNAQAAFRHGRTTRSNAGNIVDLTGSDDINETEQSTRILDVGSALPPARPPRSGVPSIAGINHHRQILRRLMRQQNHGEQGLSSETSSSESETEEEVDDDDDDDDDDGDGDLGHSPLDEGTEEDNDVTEIRMPSLRQILQDNNPPPQPTSQADRSAVRRQRQARRNWERVERRNRERAQQQAQTDANSQSQRSQVEEDAPVSGFQRDGTQESAPRRNPNNSLSVSPPSIDLTHSTKDGSSPQPVDLTGVDDEKTLQSILAKEQQDAIAAQPNPPSANNTASSLSNYKCAICMDSPTNATTTICGHLFCHRCILDSLKWSERQRREDALHPRQVNGLCPVCRKSLKNKEVSGKGTGSGGLVHLEIKRIPRKQYNDDKKREQFLADIEAGKGKQRADTEDIADIENIDTRDEGLGREGPRKRRCGPP